MNEPISIDTPLDAQVTKKLKTGDRVLLSGTLYTARDAAHKRLVELIDEGEELPVDLTGQIIYYVGPAPPKPSMAVGSAGPTSSYRMDPYVLPLLKKGLRGMIGKGQRAPEVRKAMQDYGAIYFAATGGAGALISKAIQESDIVAYADLGPEAVRRLKVINFPVIVVNDLYGNDLYDQGRRAYCLPESISESK